MGFVFDWFRFVAFPCDGFMGSNLMVSENGVETFHPKGLWDLHGFAHFHFQTHAVSLNMMDSASSMKGIIITFLGTPKTF